MASDWKVSTLGELAEIVMGQSPKGTDCNSDGHGTPLLNGPTEFGSNHPYPTQFTTDPKRFSKKDDLLFCVRGSTTGRMNWSDKEYAIGRGLAAFRHKKGKDFQSFLKGIIDIKLPELLASATGSTFPNVSKNQLNDLEVILPPLTEQKAIAHILGSLDDKIELNRQMNETLEAMAQALFKSWFVDFDPVIDNALAAGNAIPDEFIERAEQRKGIEKKDHSDIQSLFPDAFEFTEEMGWIPKGWEISTLGQESDFSNGYAFKSKELTAESKDAFHVFKMGHIKRGGGFNYDGTKSYFPIEAAKDLERYLLKKGDLLMAMTDMKSSMALLGHTALMPEDDKFLVNQRVGRLSVKEDATLNYPYIYIYSNLDTTIGELRSRANSGVQVNLSTAEIKATNILVPSRSVHDIFNVKAISFFEKTFLNDRLNRKLAETRDTLLPKLMSGEIRISDAEALVENV